MDTRTFDAIARLATEGITRRGALMAVAGAGLAAALAPPMGAAAKKKASRRGKKKANARCQGQTAQCTAFVEDFCEHSACEDAWEQVVFCCQFLDQCNAPGFLDCISF